MNKKIFIFSAVFLLMFFPVNVLRTAWQKTALLIIHTPSDNECAYVLAYPRGKYAWAFNLADANSVELARKFLASRGINHLNMYIVRGSSKNKLNALAAADKNLKLKKIIHISNRKKSEIRLLYPDIECLHVRSRTKNWEVRSNLCCFFSKKNQIGFEYFNPEAIIPLCIFFDRESRILSVKGEVSEEKYWQHSNLPEYLIYEL